MPAATLAKSYRRPPWNTRAHARTSTAKHSYLQIITLELGSQTTMQKDASVELGSQLSVQKNTTLEQVRQSTIQKQTQLWSWANNSQYKKAQLWSWGANSQSKKRNFGTGEPTHNTTGLPGLPGRPKQDPSSKDK